MPTTLTVEGMHCDNCEQTVEEALESVDGVREASVDRESGRATVEGDADSDALVEAVEETGYEATA